MYAFRSSVPTHHSPYTPFSLLLFSRSQAILGFCMTASVINPPRGHVPPNVHLPHIGSSLLSGCSEGLIAATFEELYGAVHIAAV